MAKKKTTRKKVIVSWIISLILILAIVNTFILGKYSATLLYTIIVFIIFPPARNFMEKKLNIKLPTYKKENMSKHEKKESSREKAEDLLEEHIRTANSPPVDMFGENLLSIYTGEKWRPVFEKDDVIREIQKQNFKVINALKKLVEEQDIQEHIKKMKKRKYKLSVREKAEKRLFGKSNKKNRVAIVSDDREAIFEKFNNECAICGVREGLHIHHKDNNPENNKTSNLIVLCGVCHKKIHMRTR